MVTAADQIKALNSGERAVTYEMRSVDMGRVPVLGEWRYVIGWGPIPGDPGAMLPTEMVRIIWTGGEWVVS
ncbi:hypothetical protein [Bradyrhizobium sp. 2S1]|uniref:hypothetical protein n=1 Tax=Bradyrhizobium sp. 2S1 TaxID=1404429 RepID=UPI00140E51A8|nr:hypothetical protein [Bradyrhizobium sp. 2S1]MCK7669119.1 hypothetical protein [Bradyrhizobium sp. 2S1]